MAIINCIRKDCPGTVNTGLACTEVWSLFGLRHFIDKQLSVATDEDNKTEMEQYLDYVDTQMEKFRIEDKEAKYRSFKSFRQMPGAKTVKPMVSRLYIECTNGHRDYYEVECK